ncbi:MAG TPA: hypothetical protein VIL74_01535 [Pyrinomonadaceae bacterium]|jgi:hypothetical protein
MRQTIAISSGFFCDGHCYLLTSASFGGSGLSAERVQEILFEENKEKTTALLLKKGVCFPVCFPGDCALDNATEFVLGDLTEREERAWMARLAWKLNVPCGKLILCCGCLAEDLEPAVAGEAADPHYEIYQVIDVPPAEYLVEIYAFYDSQTMRVALDAETDEYDDLDDEDFDEDEFGERSIKVDPKYREYDGAAYIIRLSPLENEPTLPKIESSWFEDFEYREEFKLKN